MLLVYVSERARPCRTSAPLSLPAIVPAARTVSARVDEIRRHQAQRAPPVEGAERHPAAAVVLGDEQAGDQVAGEHEEDVDSDGAGQESTEVLGEHQCDGDRADAVEAASDAPTRWRRVLAARGWREVARGTSRSSTATATSCDYLACRTSCQDLPEFFLATCRQPGVSKSAGQAPNDARALSRPCWPAPRIWGYRPVGRGLPRRAPRRSHRRASRRLRCAHAQFGEFRDARARREQQHVHRPVDR